MIHPLRRAAVVAGLLFASAFLTACSLRVGPQDRIGFQELLTRTAATPFECANYDLETDSCEMISRYQARSDGTVQARSTFILDADLRAVMTVTDTLRPEGARLCTDGKSTTAKVTGDQLTAQDNANLAELFLQTARAFGPSCISFFERGGVLVGLSETPDGQILRGQPAFVLTYFAEPKPLRGPSAR